MLRFTRIIKLLSLKIIKSLGWSSRFVEWKLFNINKILFIAFRIGLRIRVDESNIMHYTNAVIPFIVSNKPGRMNLTSSFKIFLSVLYKFESLNPGESVSVKWPPSLVVNDLRFTCLDTASVDCLCSKTTGSFYVANFSWYIFAIAVSAVDFPEPQSPKAIIDNFF